VRVEDPSSKTMKITPRWALAYSIIAGTRWSALEVLFDADGSSSFVKVLSANALVPASAAVGIGEKWRSASQKEGYVNSGLRRHLQGIAPSC